MGPHLPDNFPIPPTLDPHVLGYIKDLDYKISKVQYMQNLENEKERI